MQYLLVLEGHETQRRQSWTINTASPGTQLLLTCDLNGLNPSYLCVALDTTSVTAVSAHPGSNNGSSPLWSHVVTRPVRIVPSGG
jgi:hypothetical protein